MKRQFQRSSRLLKLGVMDFETPTDIARLQADLVARLASTDAARSNGLNGCSEKRCVRAACVEVCWWRRRRERRGLIPKLYDVLSKLEGPLCVVRWACEDWMRPFGKLDQVSINAVKVANRCLLASLYSASIKAIGVVKVAPDKFNAGGRLWVPEIHQVVAGVSQEYLEQKLYRRRRQAGVSVKSVFNLGQSISDVLRHDLSPWIHPAQTKSDDCWMSKQRREELYRWMLEMKGGRLIVRYGLDRQFAPIAMKQRIRLIKPRGPRPKPIWLKRYQFGYDPEDDPDLDLPADPGSAAIWRR